MKRARDEDDQDALLSARRSPNPPPPEGTNIKDKENLLTPTLGNKNEDELSQGGLPCPTLPPDFLTTGRLGDPAEGKARQDSEASTEAANDVRPTLNESTTVREGDEVASRPHSPLLSSAEVSLSGPPSESGTTRPVARRGLSRTVLTLQQSHLWMGDKAVPELDMESNTRVTRRMAAKAHQAATSVPGSADKQRARPTINDVKLPLDLSVKQEDATSQDSSFAANVSSRHKPKGPTTARHDEQTKRDAVVKSEKKEEVDDKMSVAGRKAARWKHFDLHPDHSLFEVLRYVHQISRKAPVAKEEDVVVSSSHCTPQPLLVFTNVMLKYAPDLLLEAAGCRRRRESHVHPSEAHHDRCRTAGSK
jgi:hypothetical protein